MGCAASTAAGAESRRRGWAWARARATGPSEASTSGLQAQQGQGREAESLSVSVGRRRGCKVAPEPKDLEEGTAALPPMPGSPSFRHYCQKKTAAVDKIVADANNSDCSVRIKATARLLSNRSEITATKPPQESTEVSNSQPKEGNRWVRFSGLSMVTSTWNNLFSRQRSKSSAPPAAAPAASCEP